MPQLGWPQAIEQVTKRVVKLTTPRASGTGFILSPILGSSFVVVATAAHVIDNSHYWEEPIRVQRADSSETVLLHATERAIFLDEAFDTAALLFHSDILTVPPEPIELTPEGKFLPIGNEVGWLGYPAVANALCFFSGRISAMLHDQRAYLVDGVAINGVSGGPAFHVLGGQKLVVVGVVSAYIPNRATGEALPGLSVVRDVVQFQALAKQFASIKEAKEKEVVPSTPPPPPERPPDAG